jgi:hypothetical protein
MEAMGIQPIEFTGAKAPRLTLTATPDGAHSLRVEAVANNHAPYHRDGEPVFAVTAVQAG